MTFKEDWKSFICLFKTCSTESIKRTLVSFSNFFPKSLATLRNLRSSFRL